MPVRIGTRVSVPSASACARARAETRTETLLSARTRALPRCRIRPLTEVLLTDADLESPSKKRKVCCKIVCTHMCMFASVPNMYRVSHSACVSERVFPAYYKTGDSPFRKKMESRPVAPVTPKSLPRHSRGTPEQLPSSFRAASEQLPSSLPLAARENPFSGTFWNLQKTGFEPSTPSREPGAKPTRQPCWACNKWCTGDAYKHSRTHDRSGKPSVPMGTYRQPPTAAVPSRQSAERSRLCAQRRECAVQWKRGSRNRCDPSDRSHTYMHTRQSTQSADGCEAFTVRCPHQSSESESCRCRFRGASSA